METTAAETRSVAVTRAVRREASTADWAAAWGRGRWTVAACAPAELRCTGGSGRSQADAVAARISRTALRALDARMGLLRLVGIERVGISRRHEVEALRRRRRTGLGVVAPIQQGLDVGERSPVESYVHHGSHEHAHHVVQEPVGFDVEAHPPAVGPRFPLGPREATEVMRLGFSLRGKCPKVVLAAKEQGGGAKRSDIERTAECPLEVPAEGRGGGVVGADVVAVAA